MTNSPKAWSFIFVCIFGTNNVTQLTVETERPRASSCWINGPRSHWRNELEALQQSLQTYTRGRGEENGGRCLVFWWRARVVNDEDNASVTGSAQTQDSGLTALCDVWRAPNSWLQSLPHCVPVSGHQNVAAAVGNTKPRCDFHSALWTTTNFRTVSSHVVKQGILTVY